MNLSINDIKNSEPWQEKEIELPSFDMDKMIDATNKNPTWIHFGAGNIFRGFIAVLQQNLLNTGRVNTGIVAVETYDYEIIEKIYRPYDNLTLLVIMNPDGTLDKKVVGSIGESIIGDVKKEKEWSKLKEMFINPSLQMVSLTITEKGYGLKNLAGEYYKQVEDDIVNGPDEPEHVMSKIASLAYERYKNGAHPIALVSMDNCSHNGQKFHNAVEEIVTKWVESGLVEKEFLEYINNPDKVSFPWTMIDKITPRPSESVKSSLEKIGVKSTEIVCTNKNTYIAPFVNAEASQYLVVEDSFPNGRMPLEEAGVMITDRETVDKVEKMKVCTCLNPLHTALAIYGCLLGHKSIADEMQDKELKTLIEKISYEEGLKVVVDPGIIDPKDFVKEVIESRLPNPYIPDTPQRIATDTSLKVAIRFGETIKAYRKRKDLDPETLTYIPLVIAGWCRYLMGLNDSGNEMALSPDPMLEELRSYLSDIELGNSDSVGNKLQPILSNENVFGLNLYEVGLGEKVEDYFKELIAGTNAVRNTLVKYTK